MDEYSFDYVIGWCDTISEKAEQIADHTEDIAIKQYWLGQRDALRDLRWVITWNLAGRPESNIDAEEISG